MYESHFLEKADLPYHSGSFAGYTNFIKTFSCDTFGSEVSFLHEIEGYQFSVHSAKRQLWSLQGDVTIVGIGDPMQHRDYAQFIRKLPRVVRLVMTSRFAYYNFSSENSLMFTCNNVLQLVPKHNTDMYYLYIPGSKLLLTDPFKAPTLAAREFLKDGFFRELGSKVSLWLSRQLTFVNEKRKQIKHTTQEEE